MSYLFNCLKKPKIKNCNDENIHVEYGHHDLPNIVEATKGDSELQPGWIYLIKEREFIRMNENVFKIGKTKEIKNRMPAYPRDSILYQCFYCPSNIHETERFFIRTFDEKCKQRNDIGREYYEGQSHAEIIFLFHALSKPFLN